MARTISSPHSIKYGKGLITGLMLQWQDGKQVSVWPKEVAKGQLNSRASSKSQRMILPISCSGLVPGASFLLFSSSDGAHPPQRFLCLPCKS